MNLCSCGAVAQALREGEGTQDRGCEVSRSRSKGTSEERVRRGRHIPRVTKWLGTGLSAPDFTWLQPWPSTSALVPAPSTLYPSRNSTPFGTRPQRWGAVFGHSLGPFSDSAGCCTVSAPITLYTSSTLCNCFSSLHCSDRQFHSSTYRYRAWQLVRLHLYGTAMLCVYVGYSGAICRLQMIIWQSGLSHNTLDSDGSVGVNTCERRTQTYTELPTSAIGSASGTEPRLSKRQSMAARGSVGLAVAGPGPLGCSCTSATSMSPTLALQVSISPKVNCWALVDQVRKSQVLCFFISAQRALMYLQQQSDHAPPSLGCSSPMSQRRGPVLICTLLHRSSRHMHLDFACFPLQSIPVSTSISLTQFSTRSSFHTPNISCCSRLRVFSSVGIDAPERAPEIIA
jgi:hypothetical protein